MDELLDETTEGQLVLAFFEKNGKLDNSARDQMVTRVIYHEFRYDYNAR